MNTISSLRYRAVIGILVLLLSSCASTITRFRIEPQSGDIARIDGRAVTRAERNGIVVVASFEREDMEFIAFDIEVKNKTNQPISVNPADFQYALLGSAQDTLTDFRLSDGTLVRQAADPSYETGRVEVKQKKEQKRLKTAKIVNTVLFVALIASDVATSNRSRNYNEWRHNRINHDVAWQALNMKRAIDYGTFANRMQRYDYEVHRWRDLAMKATTVAPGESVRGLIYLPKIPQAQYLGLTYASAEQMSVPLVFRQDMVQEKVRRRKR